MSNIKQLTGLKVEAIAVEVNPEYQYFSIDVHGFLEGCHNPTDFKWVIEKLPEGEWTILGRANELDFIDIGGIEDIGLPWTECKKYWLSYMAANNLTNELILIKK